MMDLKDDYKIYAVEANTEVLPELKKEFPDVVIGDKLDEIPSDIAVAVIATSSDVRRKVFDELIRGRNVSNIIFEKVLFQKKEDYAYVSAMLKARNIHAWVNCVRREWEDYSRLKDMIKNEAILAIDMSGGEWGIGSSGIHMLDLVEFLSNGKIEKLRPDTLHGPIVESRRKRFKEFYGSVEGITDNDVEFKIRCLQGTQVPVIVDITCQNQRIMVNEGGMEILFSTGENGWKIKKQLFNTPYQSQLTGPILKRLLEGNGCNLTEYEESARVHMMYIEQVNEFFRKNGMEVEACSIT